MVLADIDAAEAELRDPGPKLFRDRALAFPVAGMGRDMLLPMRKGDAEGRAMAALPLIAAACQSICLKWNSPPSFKPLGQRAVTVLVRV